jgi:hypothetical protein
MLPKSQCQSFVGFDNGSKSVKYYSTETTKILTSRNFHFLSPPGTQSPPEEIEISPDTLHEGELGVDTWNARLQGMKGSAHKNAAHRPNDMPEGGQDEVPSNGQSNLKRKQVDNSSESENDIPCRTRGKWVDYCHLQDPFSDDEDETINVVADISDESFSVAANNGVASFYQMGTWRLIDKPPNAIPIANKWVFAKKRNKQGQLTKYKARLMAKGYAQHPSYDYVEMHSPIVCLKTIHLILAIATIKGLVIQQMDVKGTYLNGVLNERVYMCQPEGFEDRMDRICELLKSLYGLKQSGQA